jgi:hypothetical protein
MPVECRPRKEWAVEPPSRLHWYEATSIADLAECRHGTIIGKCQGEIPIVSLEGRIDRDV